MLRFVLFSVLLVLGSTIVQAKDSKNKSYQKIYAAANHVVFTKNDSTIPFLGSGFLVKYESKIYGVTAKHVLLEAMNKGLTRVDVSAEIKEWSFKPFNQSGGKVLLGDLLNTNSTEKLTIDVLKDDWLVFEVLKDESNLTPLTISEAPNLKKGDLVRFFGCTYANQNTCQQNSYSGVYEGTLDSNLLIKIDREKLGSLRGMSGSPVVNSKNEVIGIVSNMIPDGEGNLYFAPFFVEPLLTYLKQVN